MIWSLNVLHLSQALLDRAAVPSIFTSTPWDDCSIGQNCSERATGSLNVLYINELVLNMTTVTTPKSITPGYHFAIAANRCKCTVGGLNASHLNQAFLHRAAVTTKVWMTPRDHRTIWTNSRKGMICRLNLLHVCQGILELVVVMYRTLWASSEECDLGPSPNVLTGFTSERARLSICPTKISSNDVCLVFVNFQNKPLRKDKKQSQAASAVALTQGGVTPSCNPPIYQNGSISCLWSLKMPHASRSPKYIHTVPMFNVYIYTNIYVINYTHTYTLYISFIFI